MRKLSPAQTRLVSCLQAGAQLALDPRTGLYALTENGVVRPVDQRPVEALLLVGLLV